jgi:hypothetical protein
MGNKPVMAIVLILVIVACVAFMVRSGTKKSGGAASSGPQERDLVCMACEKSFKATVKDEEWMPMQMQGKNASKKMKCSACGKDEGVAAQKCGSCGALVPAAGMMGMMGPGSKAPACPKCKKPLMSGMPGQGAPAAPPAAK